MERPCKRPRLSIFADEAPSAELDIARQQNDRFLKGRFEAIFQKYERDFSGIGDEVDLSTGEIIVDNGHLAGLDEDADARSEADESAGEPSPTSTRHTATPGKPRPITNGRSMLRAMTVASDRANAYFENDAAEDVIESIETIAQTAAEKQQGEEDEGSAPDDDDESDNQETPVSRSSNQAEHDDGSDHGDDGEDRDSETNEHVVSEEPDAAEVFAAQVAAEVSENDCATAEADTDSLFEDQVERESSTDSLFEPPTAASSATPHEDPISDVNFFNALGDLDRDAIIARFGDTVGQEVLSLMQQRDQAELHIEKAWRIPVQVEQAIESTSAQGEDEVTGISLRSNSPSTPKQGTSLWSLGLPDNRKLELHQERTMRVIRAESEDPLQEGFGEGGEVEVRIAEVSLDHSTRLLNRGTCPFCKEQFYSQESAKKHLREVLANTDDDGTEPTTHNTNRVHELLANLEDGIEENGMDDVEEPDLDDREDGLVFHTVETDNNVTTVPNPSQTGPNAGDESEDDLFVDAGFIHSDDDDDDDDELHFDTPIVIKVEDVPASVLRTQSPEIPESDEEPDIRLSAENMTEFDPHSPQLRFKGPSARRRRRSSSYHEPLSTERHSSLPPDLEYEQAQWPEFRATADPYDRSADQNYRGRSTKKKSQLSLRPRTARQRLSMVLPPQEDGPRKAKRKQQRKVSGKKSSQKNARISRKTSARESKKVSNGEHAPLVTQPCTSGSPEGVVNTTQVQVTLEEQPIYSDSDENQSYREYHTPREVNEFQSETDERNELGVDAELAEDFSQVIHSATGQEEFAQNADDDDDDEPTYEDHTTEPVYHFNVEDFMSLVIMHEHEGHGLESVGELMSNHYYNYRLPIDPLLGVTQPAEWNSEDEVLLHQLSMNPQTLMETIRRRLPHRSQFEIGNRLAEHWLAELNTGAQPAPQPQHTHDVAGVKIKKTHIRILELDEDEEVLEDYDELVPSRRKRKADPVRQRVCRQLSPGGTWRGCGRIFSQRSAVHRHWKDSDRVCLKPGFDRMASPPPQKRNKATKENGIQCRHASPGGTVRGCGEWFRQRSTLYRHWRNSGRECRPPWHKQSTVDTSDGEQVDAARYSADVGYDHGRAAAAAAVLNSRPGSRDT